MNFPPGSDAGRAGQPLLPASPFPRDQINPNQPLSGWRASAIFAWILLTVENLILCAGCIGLVAMAANSSRYPQDVELAVDAPKEVTVGEAFTIAFVVSNVGSQPVKILHVNIETRYLKNVTIDKTDPPSLYLDTEGNADKYTAMYNADITIPAGQSTTLSFTAHATAPGYAFGIWEIATDVGTVDNGVPAAVRTEIRGVEAESISALY